jgi:hypothetical protein
MAPLDVAPPPYHYLVLFRGTLNIVSKLLRRREGRIREYSLLFCAFGLLACKPTRGALVEIARTEPAALLCGWNCSATGTGTATGTFEIENVTIYFSIRTVASQNFCHLRENPIRALF